MGWRKRRKKIGPGEASLIHIASKIKIGSQKGVLIKILAVSKMRFQGGTPCEPFKFLPGAGASRERKPLIRLDRFELVAVANRLDALR